MMIHVVAHNEHATIPDGYRPLAPGEAALPGDLCWTPRYTWERYGDPGRAPPVALIVVRREVQTLGRHILGLARRVLHRFLPCGHRRRWSSKWVHDDTPMVKSWCPDCRWFDYGHVHGDVEGWADAT
jgi:hypothetical protein